MSLFEQLESRLAATEKRLAEVERQMREHVHVAGQRATTEACLIPPGCTMPRSIRENCQLQPEPARDPYAELKAAHAAGKVIESSDAVGHWARFTFSKPDWSLPPDRYRIKPDGPADDGEPVPSHALIDINGELMTVEEATKQWDRDIEERDALRREVEQLQSSERAADARIAELEAAALKANTDYGFTLAEVLGVPRKGLTTAAMIEMAKRLRDFRDCFRIEMRDDGGEKKLYISVDDRLIVEPRASNSVSIRSAL